MQETSLNSKNEQATNVIIIFNNSISCINIHVTINSSSCGVIRLTTLSGALLKYTPLTSQGCLN